MLMLMCWTLSLLPLRERGRRRWCYESATQTVFAVHLASMAILNAQPVVAQVDLHVLLGDGRVDPP
jgi:hypothetical protein